MLKLAKLSENLTINPRHDIIQVKNMGRVDTYSLPNLTINKNLMTQKIMYVLGGVFVLVGLLGFIMPSPLFGLFAVDTMHNIVHLLSGILAIWFAKMGPDKAAMFAKILGLVYLLVTILGFLMVDKCSILGLIHINSTDNYLHLVLAVVLLYVGFGMGGSKPQSSNMPM